MTNVEATRYPRHPTEEYQLGCSYYTTKPVSNNTYIPLAYVSSAY
ncbi:MAG TPA: hypothetical protein V6D14_11860 [Coleofasciculaceae cyanobacterium]